MSVLTLPHTAELGLTVRAKALVFEDPLSRALLARIHQIAPSDATALITGETGTGKEIVARHVHELSPRRDRPFVGVNCGAFSESLVESELFGHERGAFTGAVGAKAGWFESAEGGTLFLDEIGDLPLGVQVKLLRVLQEREVVRLGSRVAIPIDVRLIAATNVNLQDAVRAAKFREDLYYRINVAGLAIPPLRDRPGDILPLAQYFLQLYGKRLGGGSTSLTPAAATSLLAHSWPGNIRELENVIHHALLVCSAGCVTPSDLRLGVAPATVSRPAVAPSTGGPALESALLALFEEGAPRLYGRIEETVMRAAFAYCDHNQLQTARLLGISRNVVRARLIQSGELPGPLRTSGVEEKITEVAVERGERSNLVRVGHQQFGLLWLLRGAGTLDRALAAQGLEVVWSEFPSGIELCEALQAGTLDLGVVGEGPPVFAQAASAPIVYLAAEPPAPQGEAIVVHRDSSIWTVADLCGRHVLLNKGANVHYLLARALEEVGMGLADIEMSFASPSAARAAFETHAADAWVIWDPMLASLQHGGQVRVLRDAVGLSTNRAYYVGSRAFAEDRPDLVNVFLAEVRALGRAANEGAESLVDGLTSTGGIEKPALVAFLRRTRFGVQPFNAEMVAHQQRVADTSHRLKIIPRAISVADARWTAPDSTGRVA
jgi:aliphatic sulfonates family ABC transporter substrate-binding protein